MITGKIYLLTNRVSGHQYVGKTTQSVDRRWRNHVWGGKNKSTRVICRALRKYGAGNFELCILEDNIPANILSEFEIFWIGHLHTSGGYGYNMSIGGEGQAGNYPSKETRRKISEAGKGNTHSLGHYHSEATRRKMSASRAGTRNCWYGKSLPKHVLAAATIARKNNPRLVESGNRILRENARKMRGVPRPDLAEQNRRLFTGCKNLRNAIVHAGNKYFLGRKHSAETRCQMSLARKNWWRQRKVTI